MNATAQLSKLAELRAKTDRDLSSIIDNALEVGLLLATNAPDVDPAGVLHRRTVHIYADAVILVEKVEDLGGRRRLEDKLKQLHESLDRRVQMGFRHKRLHARPSGKINYRHEGTIR